MISVCRPSNFMILGDAIKLPLPAESKDFQLDVPSHQRFFQCILGYGNVWAVDAFSSNISGNPRVESPEVGDETLAWSDFACPVHVDLFVSVLNSPRLIITHNWSHASSKTGPQFPYGCTFFYPLQHGLHFPPGRLVSLCPCPSHKQFSGPTLILKVLIHLAMKWGDLWSLEIQKCRSLYSSCPKSLMA
jgi:hypothetical protein